MNASSLNSTNTNTCLYKIIFIIRKNNIQKIRNNKNIETKRLVPYNTITYKNDDYDYNYSDNIDYITD